MQDKVQEILNQAKLEIAAQTKEQDLLNVKAKYLGKEGEVTKLMKCLKDLPIEEKKSFGASVNQAKNELEEVIKAKLEQIYKATASVTSFDNTIPVNGDFGSLSPITIVSKEITDILKRMGFIVLAGPEKEFDYYNFEALNIPEGHPARDEQDTFYVSDNIVLRTQTSPMQIRTMENKKPPIRILAPGRVFRSDAVDATHSPLFPQIEGLVIDKGIKMSDLKGTLEMLMKKLYGNDCKLRFRPHHFPFTEPSVETDICCFNCGGEGCSVCKGEGWREILGGGMVHPKVLSGCGIDPEVYSGFAFGFGLERLVMGRYDINDIRLFSENDIRFLKQF